MVGPSHAIVGFASAVLVAKLAGIEPTPVLLLVLLAGSLGPDIDGGGSISRPGRILRAFLPRGIGKVVDGIGSGLSRFIQATVGHRGFFHWPILAVIMIAAAFPLHSPALLWFGIGYLSHILADTLTMEGIPFFAPFTRQRYGLRLFSTGSLKEFLLVLLIAAGAGYWGFDLLPANLQNGFHTLRNRIESFHPRHDPRKEE